MTRGEPPNDLRLSGMILAAGEGTRLRPLTADRPKPMLPVDGRPVLEFIVSWLRQQGVAPIAINLHHHPEVVTSYFGDGSQFGVELHYSVEKELLGTAGGARKMTEMISGPYVIVYGDVLTDVPLQGLWKLHASHAGSGRLTVALFRARNPAAAGVVELGPGDRVVRFVEKPHPGTITGDLAHAGIMIADPAILDRVSPGTFCDFGHDLIPLLIDEGYPVYGWRIPPRCVHVDMGTPDGYTRAKADSRRLRIELAAGVTEP